MSLKQASQTKGVHTCVVADDRQLLDTLAADSLDQVLGDAAKPESTCHDRSAVGYVSHGRVGIGEDLIHLTCLKFRKD